MSSNRLAINLCLLCSLFILTGCIKASAVKKQMPFESVQLDACLTILVDLSGSFDDHWADDAYELFLDLSEQFFDQSMGTDSRLVIAQLSAAKRVVIFDGRPADLMNRFAGPEELGVFLKSSSDPAGSPVYEATRRSIDYVRSIDGVNDETRLMTVVLSDMRESESDRSKRVLVGAQMLESLKEYQELGGGLALYFVDAGEMPRWRRILGEAGFEAGQYVIENDLSEHPRLPTFH